MKRPPYGEFHVEVHGSSGTWGKYTVSPETTLKDLWAQIFKGRKITLREELWISQPSTWEEAKVEKQGRLGVWE